MKVVMYPELLIVMISTLQQRLSPLISPRIRKPQVPDLRAPAGAQRPGSTKCSGVLS